MSTETATAPAGEPETGSAPLLEAEHVQLYFPIKQGVLIDRTIGQVHAVDDVSLRLNEGETLGVVGESGCGKSTLARCFVRLLEPTAGALRFRGQDITHLGRRALDPIRREVQLVFQDPVSSLNPRKRVGQIVGTPLRLHGVAGGKVDDRVRDLLGRVGLNPEHINRFPHEFSGGQRQRIGIARALAVEPRLIVLDEPVSALDVSIQAQVVNLLDDLQDDMGLSYVFIAHDLSVVRHVSDQIAVMYLGKLMELSPARELYTKPIHPYTEALLEAIPIPDPRENSRRERNVIGGEPPNPINPPSGCRFHTRCPHATEVCRAVEPPLAEYANGHVAACHHPRNVTAAEISAATRSSLSPLSAGQEMPTSNGAAERRAPSAARETNDAATAAREADDGGTSARRSSAGCTRTALVTMVCCAVAAGCGGGSQFVEHLERGAQEHGSAGLCGRARGRRRLRSAAGVAEDRQPRPRQRRVPAARVRARAWTSSPSSRPRRGRSGTPPRCTRTRPTGPAPTTSPPRSPGSLMARHPGRLDPRAADAVRHQRDPEQGRQLRHRHGDGEQRHGEAEIAAGAGGRRWRR